jgi:hypothetical protein
LTLLFVSFAFFAFFDFAMIVPFSIRL